MLALLFAAASTSSAVEVQRGDQLFFDYLQVGQAPGQGWRIYTDQSGNLNFQDSLGTHGLNFQGASLLNTTFPTPTLSSPTITGTVPGGASYTAPTITNPTVTGTVSGGADFSTGTVTPTGSSSAQTLANFAGQWVTPQMFAQGVTIADGASHLLSGTYATLAAARANCPDATSLTQEMAWCALDAAVNKAKTLQITTVFIPAGSYYLNLAAGGTTGNIPAFSNETIVGDGIDRTILLCDDTTGSPLPPACVGTANASTTPLVNWEMSNLTVKGYVDSNGIVPFTGGSTAHATPLLSVWVNKSAGLYQCSGVYIHDAKFYGSRYFTAVTKGCDRLRFVNNMIDRSARDGFDAWSTNQALIANNTILHSNDDAIACNNQGGGFADVTPLGSGCTIIGNTITESQGIRVVSGINVTVTGNQIRRPLGQGIFINSGNTSTSSEIDGVTVTGNTITDAFTRNDGTASYNQEGDYILIGGGPKKVAFSGRGVAGLPGTLYEFDAGSGVDAPGGGHFNISGNVLRRTLPPQVNNYTDWGFGQLWDCVFSDPPTDSTLSCGNNNTAIPASKMHLPGIASGGPLRNSLIERNVISTGGQGIVLTSAGNNDYDGLRIAGNYISDYPGQPGGIVINPGATVFDRIEISSNTLNGDPRFVADIRGTAASFTGNSSASTTLNITAIASGTVTAGLITDANDAIVPGTTISSTTCPPAPCTATMSISQSISSETINQPNGTWTSNSQDTPGIYLQGTVVGVEVNENKFFNVNQAIGGSSPAVEKNNVVYADWTGGGSGFNAGNTGIGTVPLGGGAFIDVQWDGNPLSATYGKVLTNTPASAAAEPSTGAFVQGTFVANTTPSLVNGSQVLGWKRLTTGAGNVAGTDWAQVFSPNTNAATLSGTTGSIGGGALAGGACASGTVSITGATTSMVATADPNTYPGDGAEWQAYVSAAGTVTVKVCALVALTPTASTYNVRVLQ